jgi:branched-subunit amino acid transport protein
VSGQTDFWTLAVVLDLAIVAVITRSFFFISKKRFHLPHWAERGLPYAPIAAFIHNIVMTQGQRFATLQNSRIYGALVNAPIIYWRRDTLACIISAIAVYLLLRLVLCW